MHDGDRHYEQQEHSRSFYTEPEYLFTAASALLEFSHNQQYTMPYMFGKKHQRNLRIFTAVLTVLIIVSMIAAYFSILI